MLFAINFIIIHCHGSISGGGEDLKEAFKRELHDFVQVAQHMHDRPDHGCNRFEPLIRIMPKQLYITTL